ncbi:RluA family pseudouridine synthase [Candidatus Uhrbacteria bacterium]|nr:RluA family pseudouridine synthase [Candidatus Uhrbacteria bacterium]
MNGTLTITEEQKGKRLDQILPAVLHVSRSFVQKHVKEGQVTVGDKTIPPHYFVKVGDEVAWDIPEQKTDVIANADITMPILFEDNDLLVVDKPAGLVVHQGDGHRGSDTLVNWLLHARPAVKGIGDDVLRPGIVHRLDRDVSGVMAIAKTKTMYHHLSALFASGAVVKIYEAIVYGAVAKAEDVITFPLARSKTKGWRMAARPTGEEALEGEREAITHIMRIASFQHYTHLRIQPKTGRTHQIRAHCAAMGHPIVGDALYARTALHPERAPRLFLHATAVSFVDYNGNKREFLSPLPQTFHDFLRQQI